MGELVFSELDIQPLGADAALAMGRWRIKREGDSPSGAFSLVFRKHGGTWQIVHDHTSKDEEVEPEQRPPS